MTPATTIAPSARIDRTVKVFGSGRLTIERFAVIEPYVTLDLGASEAGWIHIGMRAKLKQGAILRAYNGFIDIGTRVSVGEYSVLSGHGGLTIGAASIIAGHCYFAPSEHIMISDADIRFQGETAAGIVLDRGVWIGAHVTVQDDVEIGRGAVIGSGSVVTRSMPASTICFGVPCRPVRSRDVTVASNGLAESSDEEESM